MYKFGVRYYDPTLGRWTQQDPLGGSLFDPSTGNRYIYANDDPTNLTDPSGQVSVACVLAIAQAAFDVGVGVAEIADPFSGVFAIAGTLLAVAGAIASLKENPSNANAAFAGGSILQAFVFGTLDLVFKRVALFSIPLDIRNAYAECTA